MPAAQICFADGEILYADVPDLSFDAPVLEVEILNVDANSDWALIPCTAIQRLVIGDPEPSPAAEILAGWDRAVFRFADGDVLRSLISPDPRLGRHGGVWRCLPVDEVEVRTLAIPYAALKAVFRVAEWDGRPLGERNGVQPERLQAGQLARILAERAGGDAGAYASPPALLERIRRAAASDAEQ